jgi:hypothetical protein
MGTYLDNTLLVDFQDREASNEKFEANYGMLNLVNDSTKSVDYISPSVKQLFATSSNARNAKIPVLKDQSVVVNATPGFANIPVNLGDTDTYYFTAYDIFSGFRYLPATFEENQVDKQWYFDNVLRNVLKACAEKADDVIETNLESRKTQVLNFATQISQGDGTFTFDAGTDTLQISKAAQKDTMFPNLEQLMIANQLGGNYRIVTSPAGLVVGDIEAMKYRENNSKNINFGLLSEDRRYISNQLATSANFNGFMVRDGDFGVYPNFPYDFRNGSIAPGKEWSVSPVKLPYMNMQANVFINNEATDATAMVSPGDRTDLTMTVFQEMALWFRFYVVYRYNSDLTTRQNGVVKLLGQTS